MRVRINDKIILFRNPEARDAEQLLTLINSLVDENAQILANRKYTLKEEKDWLNDMLKGIKKNETHVIVAEHNDEIIGSVSISKGVFRQSHIGNLGVSVKRGYRGIGLGRKLMEMSIDIAKRDKKIKIIRLDVFKTNKIATSLYKKFGFKKIAVLPKSISWKNGYDDAIIMDYDLKRI